MKIRISIKLILATLTLALTSTVGQAQTPLIDTNSIWKYLSDGSDQGTAWKETLFIDDTWSEGPGKLGFSDGARTVIGAEANGFVTFYFRHTFNVAAAGNLVARYIRDDGLVLYLNGNEVFRSNMPTGSIAFDTQASAVVSGAAESQFFTNIIAASFVVPGANVLAVEVHQRHTDSTNFSSDLGFYLELFGDFPPQAPTVSVSEPDNTEVIERSTFPIYATATDVDSTITQVEFFINGVSRGIDTTSNYFVVVTGVAPAPNYVLTAVATDSQGLRATSAPVNITVVAPLPSLIPFGATWRYLDNGSDQGTAWTGVNFPDGGWSTGVAELGYGDDDEVTIVGFGGDPNNKFITTYFRHTFSVANPASISSLILRLVRDDGAAVYLNGTEVFRDNLPPDPLNYLTQATNAVEDSPILITSVNPALLIPGNNVIAVEIHQSTNTSSDISFDLNLIHNAPTVAPNVVLTTPPNGTNIPSPATFDIAARAWDLNGAVSNVQFFVDGVLIGTPDMTVSYGRTATGIGIGQHTVSAVVTDNSGQTATASVTVNVIPGSESVILVNTNQVWRYLDDGTDQGTAWQALLFNDSSWLAGPAELGFGDGDEATLISSNQQVTTYFRHQFTVANPSTFTNLIVRLRRDDGGVVYINETEVFRSNMTNDVGVAILYSDFASGTIGSETAFFVTNTNPSVLVSGTNIVAVEIHQTTLTSSDVSFEFQLVGQRPSGPAIRIVSTSETTATLSWFPAGGGYILQQASSALGSWNTAANQANPQTLTTTSGPRFFRLIRP